MAKHEQDQYSGVNDRLGMPGIYGGVELNEGLEQGWLARLAQNRIRSGKGGFLTKMLTRLSNDAEVMGDLGYWTEMELGLESVGKNKVGEFEGMSREERRESLKKHCPVRFGQMFPLYVAYWNESSEDEFESGFSVIGGSVGLLDWADGDALDRVEIGKMLDKLRLCGVVGEGELDGVQEEFIEDVRAWLCGYPNEEGVSLDLGCGISLVFNLSSDYETVIDVDAVKI